VKALAINGSPRKGGNTETLLTHVLEPLDAAGWSTELVQVGGKGLRGCLACGKCMEEKNMQCVQKKDIFNEVMAKMIEADALILGSPTYFTDVSAELKALLERSGFVALANDCAFAGKIGAAVVAARRGGATHVFDTINHMYQFSQMIIPGANYWNMGLGLDKGEVKKDAEGLANMRKLGEIIAWLGSAMKPHLDSFPKKHGHVQDEARAAPVDKQL
jgi:multimeric flavodoxin WrbA